MCVTCPPPPDICGQWPLQRLITARPPRPPRMKSFAPPCAVAKNSFTERNENGELLTVNFREHIINVHIWLVLALDQTQFWRNCLNFCGSLDLVYEILMALLMYRQEFLLGTVMKIYCCQSMYSVAVSYTHLTLPTKRIV